MEPKDIRAEIRAKRKKLGITQRELAEQMGINPQMISNIERGTCVIPPKRFKALSEILGIRESKLTSQAVNRAINRLNERADL